MPEQIDAPGSLRPGDFYEDPFFHPCLCLGVEDGFAWGVSLLDGSYPRTTDLHMSGARRLTLQEAWDWKMKGPDRVAADWREEHPDG